MTDAEFVRLVRERRRAVNRARNAAKWAVYGTQRDRYCPLINCTPDELRGWIEFQFDAGMTWGNWGVAWHIDHIKPLDAFDLHDLHEASHWQNLQPLWERDNLRKRNKWKE